MYIFIKNLRKFFLKLNQLRQEKYYFQKLLHIYLTFTLYIFDIKCKICLLTEVLWSKQWLELINKV